MSCQLGRVEIQTHPAIVRSWLLDLRPRSGETIGTLNPHFKPPVKVIFLTFIEVSNGTKLIPSANR